MREDDDPPLVFGQWYWHGQPVTWEQYHRHELHERIATHSAGLKFQIPATHAWHREELAKALAELKAWNRAQRRANRRKHD